MSTGNQGLADQVYSQLQKDNPGTQFSNDQQGQPQMQGQMQGQLQGQPQGQMSPQNQQQLQQLQQNFMMIIKNDPAMAQKYGDPRILQQAMGDFNTMYNEVFEYTKRMNQQAPNQQQNQPDENEQETGEDETEDDESSVDDIDMMDTNQSTIMKIVNLIKGPLVMTLIYAIISTPYVQDFMMKLFPKFQESSWFKLFYFSAIFFILIVGIKVIGNSF